MSTMGRLASLSVLKPERASRTPKCSSTCRRCVAPRVHLRACGTHTPSRVHSCVHLPVVVNGPSSQVLGATRQQLQLSRGWGQKSKFLMVSGMSAVDVFKKLRAGIETDILPVSAPQTAQAVAMGDEIGPAATAGAASTVARKQWEDGEELDDLAAAPTLKQQVFRN